ncbi:MAG: isopenicillin N synthase family oxygenase, partial [Actinobacteria bacterium]|nr:isopenicillin N synthase family oxygenase [Actinomycetota bacterium]
MGPDVVPVIDVAPLLAGQDAADGRRDVGEAIVAACTDPGVFQLVGHGVDPTLRAALVQRARGFFALDPEEKARIAMHHAGAAWRGWFPLGGELTSGVPDAKEGIYFGTELPDDDPRVLAGVPLHGPNLFPERPADLRPLVLTWMASVVEVGRAVLRGIAIGLGLDADHFDAWCSDPTV